MNWRRLLLFSFLLAVAVVLFTGYRLVSMAKVQSTEVGLEFIQAVRQGKIDQAKRIFVSEKEKSLPRGGYDAYFHYESGEEPNLAFLVGKPFEIGKPRITEQLRGSWCLPVLGCGDAHFVEIPLSFDERKFSPYLLPPALSLAGYYDQMPIADLQDSLRDPAQRRGTLTLRLRPDLQKGQVQNTPARMIQVPARPDGNAATASVPLMGGGLLPQAKDPGMVMLADGSPMPQAQLAALLPRLQQITLRFYIQRKDNYAPWRVFSFEFKDALFRQGDRTFTIP